MITHPFGVLGQVTTRKERDVSKKGFVYVFSLVAFSNKSAKYQTIMGKHKMNISTCKPSRDGLVVIRSSIYSQMTLRE